MKKRRETKKKKGRVKAVKLNNDQLDRLQDGVRNLQTLVKNKKVTLPEGVTCEELFGHIQEADKILQERDPSIVRLGSELKALSDKIDLLENDQTSVLKRFMLDPPLQKIKEAQEQRMVESYGETVWQEVSEERENKIAARELLGILESSKQQLDEEIDVASMLDNQLDKYFNYIEQYSAKDATDVEEISDKYNRLIKLRKYLQENNTVLPDENNYRSITEAAIDIFIADYSEKIPMVQANVGQPAPTSPPQAAEKDAKPLPTPKKPLPPIPARRVKPLPIPKSIKLQQLHNKLYTAVGMHGKTASKKQFSDTEVKQMFGEITRSLSTRMNSLSEQLESLKEEPEFDASKQMKPRGFAVMGDLLMKSGLKGISKKIQLYGEMNNFEQRLDDLKNLLKDFSQTMDKDSRQHLEQEIEDIRTGYDKQKGPVVDARKEVRALWLKLLTEINDDLKSQDAPTAYGLQQIEYFEQVKNEIKEFFGDDYLDTNISNNDIAKKDSGNVFSGHNDATSLRDYAQEIEGRIDKFKERVHQNPGQIAAVTPKTDEQAAVSSSQPQAVPGTQPTVTQRPKKLSKSTKQSSAKAKPKTSKNPVKMFRRKSKRFRAQIKEKSSKKTSSSAPKLNS